MIAVKLGVRKTLERIAYSNWCRENVGQKDVKWHMVMDEILEGDGMYHRYWVLFADPEDATSFKLKFNV